MDIIMSKFHYCTIVSNSHLFKAIALYKSLTAKCNDFCLSILCYDEEVYTVLSQKGWPGVQLLKPEDIEDEQLLVAKGNRNGWEYAWTLKPAFLRYIMLSDSEAAYFALFDADIYFYSSPNAIFEENPDAVLFLTDHNNSPEFVKYYDISGRFNSGFVGCKNSKVALMAVTWWVEQAIDWCYAKLDTENKRYGDQRYLESLPVMFSSEVHVVRSKGANAAHWNIGKYDVEKRDGEIYLDEDKLVFYHFSGLFIYNSKEYNLSWAIRIPEAAVRHIYLPYLNELADIIHEIELTHPPYKGYGFQRPEAGKEMHYVAI